MSRKRVVWVLAYAVAMALVEAAVVVYLRALAPAQGPLAVLHTYLPSRILVIEVIREAATIVMLVAAAALAGTGLWQRFLFFALAFGVWDILYYVWLRVFIGWPQSPFTWDILFLIPVPWVAPVLAPVIVSLCLVGGSLWLLERRPPRWRAWTAAGIGAGLILSSFMLDAHWALTRSHPKPFRWELFLVGVLIGLVGLVYDRRVA